MNISNRRRVRWSTAVRTTNDSTAEVRRSARTFATEHRPPPPAPADPAAARRAPSHPPRRPPRRVIMPRVLVAATLGLAAALGLTLAIVPAASGAPSNTYTVSRTVGPYNGAAKLGEPGSVPDGEG